jgi:hypothetical protein
VSLHPAALSPAPGHELSAAGLADRYEVVPGLRCGGWEADGKARGVADGQRRTDSYQPDRKMTALTGQAAANPGR